MTGLRKTTVRFRGRGLCMTVFLVIALGLVHAQAWAWGSATHAYIADKLGSTQGETNLNEIYGAMALDTFNYLFGSPYQSLLHDKAHNEAMKVWEAAKNTDPATQSAAFGYMSHNDVWGADYTAHHGGRYYGLDEGYVIAKTKDYLAVSPALATLKLPEAIAFEVTHLVVETGVDVLMKQLDPQIGNKIVNAALQRTAHFPELLVQAYAADLPLSHPEAVALIMGAENNFRSLMQLYGQALTFDSPTAVHLLSGQFADLASVYLLSYGITLPLTHEQMVAFLEEYISGAMELCQSDFAQEIDLTTAWVESQLNNHSVSPAPVPPSLMLLGSGLAGLGLAKLRRKLKVKQRFLLI